MLSLLDLARELSAAMAAAGLDARIVADPDRGAGVVIDGPTFLYDARPARAGCQDLATADVEATITVIGAGWAPEQVEALLTDASTAYYAVPAPWRPVRAETDSSTDAPLYRITVTR